MKQTKYKWILFIVILFQLSFGLFTAVGISFYLGLIINILLLSWSVILADYKFTNPFFIGAFLFYITFVFPILVVGIINTIEASGFISFAFNLEGSLFSKTLWVINIALAGYIIGIKITNIFFVKKNKKFFKIEKVSKVNLFLVIIWFVFSGFIRYKFSLGAAGRDATIGSYVGVLQHLFYTGNIILFSYYFILCIDAKNKHLFRYVIILFLILITTQISLGWRGTAFTLGLLCFILYIIFNKPDKLVFSKKIIILALALLPISAILGNYSRSQALTGTKTEYATGPSEFIEKIFFRQQGLTRLLVVMQNNDKDFLTNDFFITELNKKNISSTKYIDENYFFIKRGAKNSFGGSGPGSTFLMGGALFTFFTFLMIGVIISYFYNKMQIQNKIIYVIIYANSIIILRAILAENFGLYIIKVFITLALFSYAYNYILKTKIK
ncbi:hypothetical protein N9H31_00845 [bacterium]|nr:hypothetical protein [bacterium]